MFIPTSSIRSPVSGRVADAVSREAMYSPSPNWYSIANLTSGNRAR
jgi:hypothetical protein